MYVTKRYYLGTQRYILLTTDYNIVKASSHLLLFFVLDWFHTYSNISHFTKVHNGFFLKGWLTYMFKGIFLLELTVYFSSGDFLELTGSKKFVINQNYLNLLSC